MERKEFHRTQLIFGIDGYFLNPFSMKYLKSLKPDDMDFLEAFDCVYKKENMEILLGSILCYSDYDLAMKVLSEICCDLPFSEVKDIIDYSTSVLYDRYDCDYETMSKDVMDKSLIKRHKIV